MTYREIWRTECSSFEDTLVVIVMDAYEVRIGPIVREVAQGQAKRPKVSVIIIARECFTQFS